MLLCHQRILTHARAHLFMFYAFTSLFASTYTRFNHMIAQEGKKRVTGHKWSETLLSVIFNGLWRERQKRTRLIVWRNTRVLFCTNNSLSRQMTALSIDERNHETRANKEWTGPPGKMSVLLMST